MKTVTTQIVRRAVFVALAVTVAACSDAAADATREDVIESRPNLSETSIEPTVRDTYREFSQVVARHQAMSDRVARISRRLRVANAPLCEITRLDAGISTHQLSDYPRTLQPLALHFMALGETGRYIRSIVPDSPADEVKLSPGEQIVSGWPVRADQPLVVDNGYGPTPVRLTAELACVAPAFVVNGAAPNASTDGREIELSTALVEQVGDDAGLALIIAHEMSHVLRRHSPEGTRWFAELQADSDALILMRNAGYDIAATVADWEAGVEIHRESQSFSATHPPLDIRLRSLEETVARLEAGPEGFLYLPD